MSSCDVNFMTIDLTNQRNKFQKFQRCNLQKAVGPQELLLLSDYKTKCTLTLLIHMCNPCNKFTLVPLGVVQTHTENVENNKAG